MTVVWPESATAKKRAEDIARFLGLPLVERPQPGDFSLTVTEDRLELRHIEETKKSPGGIAVDFLTGPMRQLWKSASRTQPLARAVGASCDGRKVVDATAGLGKDLLFLAAVGCEVVAIEKDPVLFALLEDGYRRALDDDELGPVFRDRVRVFRGDAADYLESLDKREIPDVVYLDPMFPEQKKSSALPKKEMQIFRLYLGSGGGTEERLFNAAISKARHRVVVKRPSWSKPLREPVNHRYEGKMVTYDSYLSSAARARYT